MAIWSVNATGWLIVRVLALSLAGSLFFHPSRALYELFLFFKSATSYELLLRVGASAHVSEFCIAHRHLLNIMDPFHDNRFFIGLFTNCSKDCFWLHSFIFVSKSSLLWLMVITKHHAQIFLEVVWLHQRRIFSYIVTLAAPRFFIKLCASS